MTGGWGCHRFTDHWLLFVAYEPIVGDCSRSSDLCILIELVRLFQDTLFNFDVEVRSVGCWQSILYLKKSYSLKRTFKCWSESSVMWNTQRLCMSRVRVFLFCRARKWRPPLTADRKRRICVCFVRVVAKILKRPFFTVYTSLQPYRFCSCTEEFECPVIFFSNWRGSQTIAPQSMLLL